MADMTNEQLLSAVIEYVGKEIAGVKDHVDARIAEAKEEIIVELKDYVDVRIAEAKEEIIVELKDYVDTRIAEAKEEIVVELKAYVDARIAEAVAEMKDYVDTRIAEAVAEMKAYVDTHIAEAVAEMKDYAGREVQDVMDFAMESSKSLANRLERIEQRQRAFDSKRDTENYNDLRVRVDALENGYKDLRRKAKWASVQ